MFSEQHHLPAAIEPFYPVEEPNRPICLYTGTLEIIQEGMIQEGHGTVHLNWFPHPHIGFELTLDEPADDGNQNDCTVLSGTQCGFRFPEIETPIESFISINDHVDVNGRQIRISGRLRKPIIVGSGQNLSHIQFHLTNFEDFFGSTVSVIEDDRGIFHAQRGIFEANGWKITIDQLRTTTNDIKKLKSTGGYAITHVGKLERATGELFTADDSVLVLKALSDFLSFVKGFRVVPLLLIGYDFNASPVWQEWAAANADPWQQVTSWSWGLTAKSIAPIFPGFLKWWNEWNDAARRVIYWYVESNTQAGAIEGSCVLEQATLELIVWTCLEADLIEDSKLPKTERKFRFFSQKLNYLFSKQGIPQSIPSDLTTLIELANSQGWENNGAVVFVKVRNNITHSEPENRRMLNEMPVAARVEAWTLGLWYLELVLLSFFNYQEGYFNRLRRGDRWFGDLDPVPWT